MLQNSLPIKMAMGNATMGITKPVKTWKRKTARANCPHVLTVIVIAIAKIVKMILIIVLPMAIIYAIVIGDQLSLRYF